MLTVTEDEVHLTSLKSLDFSEDLAKKDKLLSTRWYRVTGIGDERCFSRQLLNKEVLIFNFVICIFLMFLKITFGIPKEMIFSIHLRIAICSYKDFN